MTLDAAIPAGPIEGLWDQHKFEMKLVAPHNRRRFKVIVLPQTICLSDVEVQALRAFVASGGMLIADALCHQTPNRTGRFQACGWHREC